VHICRDTKQGATWTRAAPVPGVGAQAAMPAAHLEIERLRATDTEQTVVIDLVEGNARWD